MKFILKDKRYRDLDPSIQKELSEKLFSAEENIAILRFFVILLNTFVYLFLLDKIHSIEWLALSIIVIANSYSIFVITFKPYKKHHLFLASYFTSGTDALLITLWITATGGGGSPFYLLWYVSILAIAVRYSEAVTYRVALIYALLYLLVYGVDQYYFQRTVDITDLIIRLGYLAFMAVLGGLMTKEILDQMEDKILIKKSEEEIKIREQQLQEAHDKLEERVEERTIELAESNKQLLRINEDIDSFVYSASHDLKSPISNIEALIDMLYDAQQARTKHEEDIKEKLNISVERMKKTINDLAGIAKEQKEVYDDVASISFEEILKEVILENEEIIKKENAKLELDFASASEVVCSRTCIKSILYNLLTNAIKYKDSDRSPVIKFRTERDKSHITLFIQDNGLGIDLKKNRPKLFILFKRFHDHVEGAGIGLYMVKKLVEKNHGDIDVESQPGVGTTFKVRFKISSPSYLASI